MSVVTSIIFSSGFEEPAALNKYLGQPLIQTEECAGGNKAFQADIYIGAFNNIDADELIQIFKDYKWQFPESAQLMIKREHDDKFTIYSPVGLGDQIGCYKNKPDVIDMKSGKLAEVT